MTLCPFAAECHAAVPLLPSTWRLLLSNYISCLHGAQQQTDYTLLLQSNDRTDGRTDSRPLYIPCSAYYVGSANKPATAESTALLHYFTHFERITQEIYY